MIRILVTIARIASDVEQDAIVQTMRAVQADCTVAFWCADCETGNRAPGADRDALPKCPRRILARAPSLILTCCWRRVGVWFPRIDNRPEMAARCACMSAMQAQICWDWFVTRATCRGLSCAYIPVCVGQRGQQDDHTATGTAERGQVCERLNILIPVYYVRQTSSLVTSTLRTGT
jgi:hypothetical protein